MSPELDDAFWNELVNRIDEGEVIPVVGPGAVTFGPDDELLHPWLARRLAESLDPPLKFDTPARDLQEVVDAQRAQGQPIDRVYKHLHKILGEPVAARPGATMTALAAIEGFKLFVGTTFDLMLSRAVETASPGGRTEERRGASSLRGACPDLPQELAQLERPFVYRILGAVQPYRDFVVWDDDVFRFLLRLDQQLPQLPRLLEALQKSHLLVLGLRLDHWLLRFFVQVVKRQPLSDLAGAELYVFEQLEPPERDRVVVYFSRLTKKIRVAPADPLAFVSELHARWRRKHPSQAGDPYLLAKGHRERHGARGCIFVSYASPDLEVARHVVRQLQDAGCLVWFDKEQIQFGQDWKEVLREAVDERCGLFLSLISGQTSARHDGFNIFERNRAAKRRDQFADNAVFYVPMRIDDGQPLIPDNEPRGTKSIQGMSFAGGNLTPDFIGRLRELQRDYLNAHGLPVPQDAE